MRWGAVEAAQLPSERKFVDRYREQHYQLTTRGRELAGLAGDEPGRVRRRGDRGDHRGASVLPRAAGGSGRRGDRLPGGLRGRGRDGPPRGRKVADWAAWGAERIAGEPTAELVERELKNGA